VTNEAVVRVLADGVSSTLIEVGIVAFIEATNASGLVALVGRFVDVRLTTLARVAARQVDAVRVSVAIIEIRGFALVDDCKRITKTCSY
jgi:hypothetical protein